MSHNQVLDDSPWLAPGAIVQMDSFLAGCDEPCVWEWGAGGSSLWFAERAAEVRSVESNREWYERTLKELRERDIHNVELSLLTNIFGYVHAIPGFPPMLFDLILVDGMQRNACVLVALFELRAGGWLVLDNTEREVEYAEALSLLKDWQRSDYAGDGFQTSIFVKP